MTLDKQWASKPSTLFPKGMALSHAQWVSLAIAPKAPALLSMISSGWIVLEVTSNAAKRRHLYHRIMCAFAVMDILFSQAIFASTWPIPHHVSGSVVGNVGNDMTCNLQGFVNQMFASASFLYVSEQKDPCWKQGFLTCNLSTRMWCLRLTFCWQFPAALRNQRSKSTNGPFTRFLSGSDPSHLSTVWCILCTETRVYGAGLPAINSLTESSSTTAFSGCRHSSLPWVCLSFISVRCSWKRKLLPLSRLSLRSRLPNHRIHRQLRPRPQKKGPGKWRYKRFCMVSAETTSDLTLSHFEIVFVFYFTHAFGTCNRVYQAVTGDSLYAFLLLQCCVLPFQGFLNLLIYRRQYILYLRKEHPEWTRFELWSKAFTLTTFRDDEDAWDMDEKERLIKCSSPLCRNGSLAEKVPQSVNIGICFVLMHYKVNYNLQSCVHDASIWVALSEYM